MKSLHFLLPQLLLFQDSFESALKTLASEPINFFPAQPEPGLAKDLSTKALQYLNPEVGIKIGRPEYYKARSIKHCCRMVDRRRMSMERKYDGEYCQIHIDLTKHPNSIQIFSKSGKDSTADRSGVHHILKQALRIGTSECRFSRRCIVEGELLVWSSKHGKIADFHKLRKFISRSGVFIGTDHDSPPQPYEHLMIVLFDILALDDDVCLRKPHRERRLLLKDAVQVIDGRADIAEQRIIDFSRFDGQVRLESIFAKGVEERWEGFVLKGCEDPYFPILSTETRGAYGRWIKLKKDYIPGLGDTVDLALVGAKYEARDATALKKIRKLLWTHFFIGCLDNKQAVCQFNATPKFRVVDVIDRNCMSERNMQILNQFGEFRACGPESGHGFCVEYGQSTIPHADVIFKTPFVVEMLGSGFEKRSGSRIYTLRFPRIQKIHWDRTFEDAVSLSELQLLAESARSVPGEDVQEHEEWTKRLKQGTRSAQYIVQRSQSVVSTTSTSSRPALSPVKRSTWPNSPRNSQSGLDSTQEGSAERPQLRKNTNVAKNNIDIYVDKTAESVSSSDESYPNGNFLAENDNLSSQPNSRKRKLDDPSSKTAQSNPLTQNLNTPKTMNAAVSPLKTRKRCVDRTGVANGASVISKSSQTSAKSPLEVVPFYINHAILPEKQCTSHLDVEFTHEIDVFFQKLVSQETRTDLKNSNPFAVSQGMALGLVLIESGKGLLDAELVEFSNKLMHKAPNLPSRGKIFFLDANFMNLEVGKDDLRLCLRSTWENIGKEYFYACISWSPEESGSTNETTGEIPCKPWESNNQKNVDCVDEGSKKTGAPKVAIIFEKDELTSLGEFTSIEPLVHFAGQY
ncbi:hypothetical protein MW887_007562 [Aspergillus wentii]|nr:hypothetical protein MW887_007562 [Aspergillus wentii]